MDRAAALTGRWFRRAWPVLLALAASAALLAAVLGRARVGTDITAFLPAGDTPAARLMLRELRQGQASGLMLAGIEGAPVTELARISRTMAAALPGTGLFAQVVAGNAALGGGLQDTLFAHRYLLSPASTPDSFAPDALRRGMQGVRRALASSAGPLAVRFGLADPTGTFPAMLGGLEGASRVRAIDGAWFDPERDRALLLAQTRAGGLDGAAQEQASAALEAAFRAAGPGSARLLVAGPAVFARDAARAIRGDVELISVVSTLLVAGLLAWRFRSPLVIAAIGVPVVLSVAAAVAVTGLVFGSIQGAALGFGITMLGITVDYPVLMVGHRKRGEPAAATRARIGRAFVLAVVTATLGVGGLLLSGFPGLAQLGAFAATGLLAGAAATWFLLPRLIVAADLGPVWAGDPERLLRIERWRRFRLAGVVVVLAAGVGLLAAGGPRWQDDLAALSPVPERSRALDAELRGALGAADTGQALLVQGVDAEEVLRREEALLPVLDRLRAEGVVEGFEAAARILPSAATQRARQDALPGGQALAAAVEQAQAGMGFRAGAFQPFEDGVAAARVQAPLTPAGLAGTPLAARLQPLLGLRDDRWQGTIAFRGVRNPARLRAALAGGDGVFVDIRAELGGILADYTTRAWRWLGVCLLLILAALAIGLRDARRVLRVSGAVAAAVLVTVAVLAAGGARLSLIHLVALQLVAGVGLDYALFFARPQLDAEERARTLRTLVTCNAMTLLTFGLLASCGTPFLRDIGVTVAIGAVLAMCAAFLFAGPRMDA